MKYVVAVEIDVKNDALTQESEHNDIAVILLDSLANNKLSDLPWVLEANYGMLTRGK